MMNKKERDPEVLLREYFKDRVSAESVPEVPILPESSAGDTRGFFFAGTAAAVLLFLCCLGLYGGIGRETALSRQISYLYKERNMEAEVEKSLFSASRFINKYIIQNKNL